MEIDIALDTYDDLFSDFDIRGYGERALSKDFLDELRVRLRRSKAAPGNDIVFLIPAERRVPPAEELIVRRLRVFFADRSDHYRRENAKAERLSLAFVAIGVVLSVAANLAVARAGLLPIFSDFVLIPSWFFVWTGLETFVKGRMTIRQKRKYYAALSGSRLGFASIEEYRRGP